MTAPFRAHGQRTWRWTTVDCEARDELGQGLLDRREELEEVAETRDAVVGRQELREHEAAAHGAGKDDAVVGRCAREGGEGSRRPRHFKLRSLDERLREARDSDRKREPPALPVRG